MYHSFAAPHKECVTRHGQSGDAVLAATEADTPDSATATGRRQLTRTCGRLNPRDARTQKVGWLVSPRSKSSSGTNVRTADELLNNTKTNKCIITM